MFQVEGTDRKEGCTKGGQMEDGTGTLRDTGYSQALQSAR